MGIRKYRPTSAGRRGGEVSDFAELTRRRPEKSLVVGRKRQTGGRNHQGKITSRFRGGGHKRRYRLIDFKRNKDGVPGSVASIEYDPNRSARIALIHYADGEKRYILCPDKLAVGDEVVSGDGVEPRAGNAMSLASVPLGTEVHCVEMQPNQGAALARSAGTRAVLQAREGKWATLALPSGEVRRVNVQCRATIGVVGNSDHMNITIGKAGRNRWRGRRPHTRGSAMNPVAHPMGGGEGRRSGGRHPVSPTGKLAKGGKTRKKRNASNRRIIRRRKAK